MVRVKFGQSRCLFIRFPPRQKKEKRGKRDAVASGRVKSALTVNSNVGMYRTIIVNGSFQVYNIERCNRSYSSVDCRLRGTTRDMEHIRGRVSALYI